MWLQLMLGIITGGFLLPGKVFKMAATRKSVGKRAIINQTYPSPICESMFKGMEWLPYEEWLSKTGIVQLGKARTKGTYCRRLQNSHKNLTALRDVQQFWRVGQCVGDTLPQIWLVSFC